MSEKTPRAAVSYLPPRAQRERTQIDAVAIELADAAERLIDAPQEDLADTLAIVTRFFRHKGVPPPALIVHDVLMHAHHDLACGIVHDLFKPPHGRVKGPGRRNLHGRCAAAALAKMMVLRKVHPAAQAAVVVSGWLAAVGWDQVTARMVTAWRGDIFRFRARGYDEDQYGLALRAVAQRYLSDLMAQELAVINENAVPWLRFRITGEPSPEASIRCARRDPR